MIRTDTRTYYWLYVLQYLHKTPRSYHTWSQYTTRQHILLEDSPQFRRAAFPSLYPHTVATCDSSIDRCNARRVILAKCVWYARYALYSTTSTIHLMKYIEQSLKWKELTTAKRERRTTCCTTVWLYVVAPAAGFKTKVVLEAICRCSYRVSLLARASTRLPCISRNIRYQSNIKQKHVQLRARPKKKEQYVPRCRRGSTHLHHEQNENANISSMK